MKKEEILKFYQNYRLYIFPTIVALSSLILIIFVIYPQTIKLITNQKTEGEFFDRSKFLEVKAQTLETYDEADLNKKLNFALMSYPTDKDFVSVFGLLQNLAAQFGFSAVSIALGGGSSQDTASQSYNIRLDILGPVSQLPNLLSKIESSSRLMRINSFDINEGKDPQAASINLSIEVLYSSFPQQVQSIDAPLPELSQQDEEVIARLAVVTPVETISEDTGVAQITPILGPRGKENPFE